MTDNQATPRFPGYREMAVHEILQDGDMYFQMYSSGSLVPTLYAGTEILPGSEGSYFRPIPVTPAAAPTVKESLTVAPIISKTEITTEPKAAPEGVQGDRIVSRGPPRFSCPTREEFDMIYTALAERSTLTAALAKAREALEFYATGTNWLSEGWQTSPAVHDHGKIARAALGNLEQKGGSK